MALSTLSPFMPQATIAAPSRNSAQCASAVRIGVNNVISSTTPSPSQIAPSIDTEHESDTLSSWTDTSFDTADNNFGPSGLSLLSPQPRLPELPLLLSVMAPLVSPRRDLLPKERFAFAFGSLKTQSYVDPNSRSPGSHTIRTLAWNPTGQLIATGSADRTLRIWNPERPLAQYSTELRGHAAGIEKALFNPVRDAELASCSADGTVRIWDVRSATCVSRLNVGGEAFTMSWSADGKMMMVGRKDDTLVPISIESASSPVLASNGAGAPILSTGTSTKNESSKSTYTILEGRPQPVETNATTFSHHIPTPSSSSSSYSFFATTGEGTVKIISYPSFQTLHTLHAHTSACLSIELSPTGRYLAIGGSDALISLWDTTEWICKRTVASSHHNGGSGGTVRGVSWSFDGRFVCGACDEVGVGGGGSGNGGIEIFHAETGESVFTVPTNISATGMGAGGGGGGPGGGGGIPAVAWHPSRYWLAYSTTATAGASVGGLRIVGAAGGSLSI